MNTTAQEDRANGIRAIQYFHDYSRANYPLKYNFSFAELTSLIDGRGKASIAGLGLGITMTDTSWSKVKDAMENLAREAQGDIPSSNNAFNMALSNRLQEIDFDAISEITAESASDLVHEAESIGNKALKSVQGAFDIVGGAKIVIPVALGLYLISKSYFSSQKGKKK